ncbi:MAG: tandem-95 repeat protein, partial [Novosphingobium sp.]
GRSFLRNAAARLLGTIGITVTASDGVLTASDSFILTVTPVNDAPALAGTLADIHVAEDGTVDFTLSDGTFTDVDGDSLALSAAQSDGSPLPGWLSFDGSRFTGTPPADFNGSRGITVRAGDGELAAQGSFTLTIDPVNDAPLLTKVIGDMVVAEDHTFALPLALDAFADVDGDVLAFTVTRSDGTPLPGWMHYADGQLTGTPPQDFNGALGLAITASDGDLSVAANFVFTVLAVNDAPVVARLLPDVSSAEDAAVDLVLDAGAFSDVDGDTLTLTARRADGSALPVWLAFDGNRFTGTPPQNFNGYVDITVYASDGLLSANDTFRLAIDPVNDAPALLTPLADVASAEDAPLSVALPTDAFGDVDGDALAFSAALASGDPLPSWLGFDGTTFTGTPPQDFNGAIDITVTASDGALTASDTFHLTVSPVNDAPVLTLALADQDVLGGYPIDIAVPDGTFTDVDGDPLTLSATLADGSALPGWLSFDGTRFTGTTANTFGGEFDISVTASDGEFAAADDFNMPMQELTTEYCWGSVWGRETLPLKTRSMLNLAMLTALNRAAEVKLHVRGAVNNGVSVEEIRETLLHATVYCGIPAGLDAFKAADEVLRRCRELLPAYMVPSTIVPLDQMPLMPSGKVDRKKIKALGAALPTRQEKRAGGGLPVGEMEVALASLWRDVLRSPPAHILADDSFFQVGGDSYSAMKLVTAARARGIGLNVAAIMQTPKLSDMAKKASRRADQTTTQQQSAFDAEATAPFSMVDWTPEIQDEVSRQCGVPPDCNEDLYPCTPLQEGLFVLSVKQAGAYVARHCYRLPRSGIWPDRGCAEAGSSAGQRKRRPA